MREKIEGITESSATQVDQLEARQLEPVLGLERPRDAEGPLAGTSLNVNMNGYPAPGLRYGECLPDLASRLSWSLSFKSLAREAIDYTMSSSTHDHNAAEPHRFRSTRTTARHESDCRRIPPRLARQWLCSRAVPLDTIRSRLNALILLDV